MCIRDSNLNVLRKNLNWNLEPFSIPESVEKHMEELIKIGEEKEIQWNESFTSYKEKYPQLADEFDKWLSGEIDDEYLESDEFWAFEKGVATREASGIIINRLAEKVPNLFGGSADLAPSNLSLIHI